MMHLFKIKSWWKKFRGTVLDGTHSYAEFSLKVKSWWQKLPEHICITIKMFFVLLAGLSTACSVTYIAFFNIFGNILRPGLQYNAGKMLSRMQNGDNSEIPPSLQPDNLSDGDVQRFVSPDGSEQFLLRGRSNRDLLSSFIERTQSELQWTILILLIFTTIVITILGTIAVYFSVKRSIDGIKEEHEKSVELVHNISHDLRTPLSSIQGWANLLRIKTSGDKDNQEILDKIEKIEGSAKRMNGLIDDMLLLADNSNTAKVDSKVDAKTKNNLESPTKADLISFVNGIITDFNSSHNSHYVKFRAPNQEIIINDKNGKTLSSIRRITENLLQNILHHTPANTESEVIIKGYKNEKILVLEVRDFGPGIASGLHESAFNRFAKVDNSRNSEGNGLGLAIVKELTNELGGIVKSRATNPATNTGLTITVMLPVK